ncbi:hypothetical protein [Succinispira mobilis]|uniref:hypothetical protein n=1 Tax=Succinispira mobilis TaxID=78120 RepID=UPI000381B322|nr:hypothetical protein [Succinispira mobilis]
MPIIDFREIPEAHLASGLQDTFELFARDFFVDIFKFKIISEPSRGADGGKDLLVSESHQGTLSASSFTWLVSCKHKAHSGKTITSNDENNIKDRLSEHKANGFIGFYSTLPSSGLNNRFESFKSENRIEIFDREKIEKYILEHKRYELFKRYFPKSYKRWIEIDGKNIPSKIFDSYQPLSCIVCGKDLLKVERKENVNHGIIGMVIDSDTENNKCTECYVACIGECDRRAQAYYWQNGKITAWDELSDLLIPTIYIRRYMALINQLQSGEMEMEDKALEDYKKILLCVSQYVFRHQSAREMERVKILAGLPDGI